MKQPPAPGPGRPKGSVSAEIALRREVFQALFNEVPENILKLLHEIRRTSALIPDHKHKEKLTALSIEMRVYQDLMPYMLPRLTTLEVSAMEKIDSNNERIATLVDILSKQTAA